MASVNTLLNALEKGDQIKDFAHASRLFVDNNYELQPRFAHLFAVVFNFTPDAARLFDNVEKMEIPMLVKSIGLPSFSIDTQTPNYYHPGKSGAIYQNLNKSNPIAYFGEAHPNVLQKIELKTDALILFEIFLDRIKSHKNKLKDLKTIFQYSDFQKSERDFAFVIDKNFKVQELINIISQVDKDLIKAIKVFDVYEGENIEKDKKSVALNVTIQSSQKSLTDDDLNRLNKLIISSVENKTGAKLRS